ncbi:MAG: hypothetical protein GFH27_549283n140 [Chloroflexi bacterium AL-W]|nr:hypothetical protein [Chloroflexi bacterium AL-N1]NOK64739.1 hypothetical protein [Chloroflexi bacterium AL-N10]NOK75980.1 hypothetical protein [Chloroflexi bacterium AL-N5]NOK80261.1 hypothetical protein [Chloroflexi bacterium AL-W]NOK86774.1 hypothetical protein [Chloroflexi bacterium AL-N15]
MLTVPIHSLRRIFQSPGPIHDPKPDEPGSWRWAPALHAAGFGQGDIVLNAFGYHLTPAGAMFEEGAREVGCTVVPGGIGNQGQQIETIVTLGVTAYVGLPSYLKALLENAQKSDCDCRATSPLTADTTSGRLWNRRVPGLWHRMVEGEKYMMQLHNSIIIVTTVGLLLTACTNTTAQTPNPTSTTDPLQQRTPVPAQTNEATSAPLQGPAVISNDSAITAWAYLGHESVTADPASADKVREFGDRIQRAWLVENEEGYELIWVALPCSTQPIVVIAEASLDLWPGESVRPDCDAMSVVHLITITTEITTLLEQWTLTLHPPSYK